MSHLNVVNQDEDYSREGILVKLLRWVIGLFFIATLLNPFVNGITLYLWIPLVFLDYQFLRSFKSVSLKTAFLFILWFTLCVSVFRYDLAIKSFALFLGVAYMHKIGSRIVDKIYYCMILSILWCVLQFTLYYINREYSGMIGPQYMSKLIWGAYSTPTFTNQYELFLLPRMSGLSREAGFFVSLLVVSFVLRVRDHKLRLWEKILFGMGYAFSLSKASILLVLYLVVRPFKRVLKKVPATLTFLFFISAFMFFAHYLNVGDPAYFVYNQSVAHRLSAAYMVPGMDISSLIYGCNSTYDCFIGSQALVDYLAEYGLKPSVGLLGIVIELGFVGLLGVIAFFLYMKMDSYDIAIIVIFTATVSFFTIDSFTILAYYYIYSNHYPSKKYNT